MRKPNAQHYDDMTVSACLIMVGENSYLCKNTHRRFKTNQTHIVCCGNSPQAKGPGDYLHDSIRFWLREKVKDGCQCPERIAQMNAWGPTGCREHLDEVVEWMLTTAKERGWELAGAPGAALVCRAMILRTIRKSERAAKTHKANESSNVPVQKLP